MYGVFAMIAKDFFKALEECDKHEFCENQKHKGKPVLLPGRK
jgi:hypothetical protein